MSSPDAVRSPSPPTGLLSPAAPPAKSLPASQEPVPAKTTTVAAPILAAASTSDVDGPAVKESTGKPSAMLDITKHVNDITAQAQDAFDRVVFARYREACGYAASFAATNLEYKILVSKRQENHVNVIDRFNRLKSTDAESFKKLKTSYNKLLFQQRLTVLHTAAVNLFLEFSFLNHSIIGNESYLQSISLLDRTTGNRYGARYRCSQIQTALDARKLTLGIKEVEKSSSKDDSKGEPPVGLSPAGPVAAEALPVPAALTILEQFREISKKIDVLKEEVTICLEALKLKIYPTFKIKGTIAIGNETIQQGIRTFIAASGLPVKYYKYYKARLAQLQAEMAAISAQVPDRIVSLDRLIRNLARTPTSPMSITYQQERLELVNRQAKIAERQVEVEQFLDQMKIHFKLVDEPVGKEPMTLDGLSAEYTPALDLITRVTALKEEILLSDTWDSSAPPEQRIASYFKFSNQAAIISREVAKFEMEQVTPRTLMIDRAIDTYMSYYQNMQRRMTIIEANLSSLEQASSERASWKTDFSSSVSPSTPKLPASPASPPQGSSSWLASMPVISLLWGSPPAAVEPATSPAKVAGSTASASDVSNPSFTSTPAPAKAAPSTDGSSASPTPAPAKVVATTDGASAAPKKEEGTRSVTG